MAKNNRLNFLEQSIKNCMMENGNDNIFYYMTPEYIQKSAKKRIFKEMIRGEIDYTKHGIYFTDPKFTENLLIVARDEFFSNDICFRALREYDLHHPGDNRVTILLGKYYNRAVIYNELYKRLSNMSFDNYNVGHLADLSTLLFPYRNQL